MPDAAPTPQQEKRYAGLRADIEETMAAFAFTREDRIANYGYAKAYFVLGLITSPQLDALVELLGITYDDMEDINV